MSNAWETTFDDIENVLNRMGYKGNDEVLTRRILGDLDHNEIEAAALHGDAIEDQTDYAYDEIERQIKVNKLL